MRKFIYLILCVIIGIASCTEDDGNFLSGKIVLKEITLENGRVKLEWNRPYIQNFSYYAIYKTNVPFESYYNYAQSIAHITDIEQTIFYTDLSLEESTYYTVVAYSQNNEPVMSNSQKLNQDGLIIFDKTPSDVVFCPQKNRLFVFIENKVYSCNYDLMEITDTIILGSSNNKGSVGNYNGVYELYVGCSNGYLRIYDMDNFTEKESIFIGGNVISALLDSYNNLYVKTYLNYNGKIVDYQRSNLNYVDEYSSWYSENGKIKHFNNSDRILEISDNYYIVYYDHDHAGNIISSNYFYNYNYPKSQDIFEVFPDDDKFITHQSGAIYNSSLDYLAQLGDSYYDYYTSFYVSDYIYAASAEQKEVRLFSKTTYSLINTYNTGLYPRYVFNDEDELIVFGSNYTNYYYNELRYSIEKITLNK